MNFGALKALLWELWYPRWIVIFALIVLIPLAVVVSDHWFPELASSQLADGAVPLIFLTGLIYVLSASTYAEFSNRSLQTGFPQHVLRLPVATLVLVAVPLVSGTSMVAGYAGSWLEFIFKQDTDFLWPTVVLAAIGVSWIQALSWGLNRIPLIASTALVVVTACTAAFAMTLYPTASSLGLMPKRVAVTGLAVVLATGIGLAYRSVVRARRGQLSWSLSFNGGGRLPGLSLPQSMTSGAAAQFRYEWRIFGWVLPLVATLLGLFSLSSVWNPGEPWQIPVLSIIIFIYVSTALGLEMPKSQFRKDDYQMTSFWATRALSDAALASAKLKLAAATILLGSLVLTVGITLTCFLSPAGPALMLTVERIVGSQDSFITSSLIGLSWTLLPLLAWIGCSISMSVCLNGFSQLGGRLILLAGPILVVIAAGVHAATQSPDTLRWLANHWMAGGLSLAVALMVVGTLLVGKQGRFAPATMTLALLAGLYLALWSALILSLDILRPIRLEAMTIGLILIQLAILPILIAPLAVARNRHR